MKRTLVTLLASLLSLVTLSCGDDKAKDDTRTPQSAPSNPAAALPRNLREATAAMITYTVGSPENPTGQVAKTLVVGADRLGEFLATITVVGTDKDVWVGSIPFGKASFSFAEQGIVNTTFIKAGHIEWEGWGQVYLGEELYRKACELASAAEGRTIDVLLVNDQETK